MEVSTYLLMLNRKQKQKQKWAYTNNGFFEAFEVIACKHGC